MLGERVLPQSEVSRAVLLEGSPWCSALLTTRNPTSTCENRSYSSSDAATYPTRHVSKLLACRGTWAPRVVVGSGESLNFDGPFKFSSTTGVFILLADSSAGQSVGGAARQAVHMVSRHMVSRHMDYPPIKWP